MAEPSVSGDYGRLKTWFNAVCELPGEAAQRARLAELGADAAQAERVLAMLRRELSATTRFSQPVAGMLASASGSELKVGDRLGSWSLIDVLGEGGMGSVFLAERSDGHYQQRAAVKLLRGWSSPEALARLARERQILASLTHPNIARLIDGGTTPMGRPYLVLDFVAGRPIDAYCAEHRLNLAQRLALFAQVCDAVAQAHRQLVVHCDLKPSNVLVTPEGRAMLLDFGIAQLQSDGPGEAGAGAGLALTPRYASPEQRAGQPASSASDIYSLGRMLEELIEPLGDAAERPREWKAMVAKASALQPDRRYATVLALRADLERFRQHRPLAALLPDRRYVAAKLLRRRWPWVLAGSGAAVVALLFTLRVVHERDRALDAERLARVETQRAQRAEARALDEQRRARAAEARALVQRDLAVAAEQQADRERTAAQTAQREAQREAETTRQVSDFVVSLFEGADPRLAGRPDLPAAVLVDKGRERVERDLRGQPALQASMMSVLGQVYENVGRPREAAQLYEQAAALERSPAVDRPLREAAVLSRLALTLTNADQPGNAEAPARRSLALRLKLLPRDALELADAHNTLGLVLSGRGAYDEGRRHLARALEIKQARLKPDDPSTAATLHNLGQLARQSGDLTLAEQYYRQALDIKLRRLGERDLSTLVSREGLAMTLAGQRRLAEAETLFRQALQLRLAVNGETSSLVARLHNEIASVLQDAGRLPEAVQEYQRALAVQARVSGTQSLSYAVSLNNLATVQEEAGDVEAAEAGYRGSLALRQAQLRDDDLQLARARINLGRFLLRSGRVDEAQPLIERGAAARGARLPEGHADLVDARLLLAELALRRGDPVAAATALAAVQAQAARLLPRLRPVLARVAALLAAAQGRPDEARRLRQQALAAADELLPAGHPACLPYALDLAEQLVAEGDREQAERLLAPLQAPLAQLGARSPLRARADQLGVVLARR